MDSDKMMRIADAVVEALLAMSDEEVGALSAPGDAVFAQRIAEAARHGADAMRTDRIARERTLREHMAQRREDGRPRSPGRLKLAAPASAPTVDQAAPRGGSDPQPRPWPSRSERKKPEPR